MSPIYTLNDHFRLLPATDFNRVPLRDGGLYMKRILSLLACLAILGVPAFAADTPLLQKHATPDITSTQEMCSASPIDTVRNMTLPLPFSPMVMQIFQCWEN